MDSLFIITKKPFINRKDLMVLLGLNESQKRKVNFYFNLIKEQAITRLHTIDEKLELPNEDLIPSEDTFKWLGQFGITKQSIRNQYLFDLRAEAIKKAAEEKAKKALEK